MDSEDTILNRLEELQKLIGRKATFEESITSLLSIILEFYPSSPAIQKSVHSVVRRVATILQTRYTLPQFWLAGLSLFETLKNLVSDPLEEEHLEMCIAKCHAYLQEADIKEADSQMGNNTDIESRFLFEGHVTVDPEPPPPDWLVRQNFIAALAAEGLYLSGAESSRSQESDIWNNGNTTHIGNSSGVSPQTLDELINITSQEISILEQLRTVISTSLEGNQDEPRRRPPASKMVVANLPVIIVDDAVMSRMGEETECAICREAFVNDVQVQELPCTHFFHPECLKPWLEENNSCPVCRSELQTDDYEYEIWKEREREAEEERKGAANALRGGEYMYV